MAGLYFNNYALSLRRISTHGTDLANQQIILELTILTQSD
jgi:hypothetical protein